MTLCFIGYGAMARAIAKGILKEGDYNLRASAPSLTPGMTIEGIKTFKDNKEAVQGADVIVLAVKPQLMSTVLEELLPVLSNTCLLISVAAGLPLSWFNAQGLGKRALIRTMPNTPAALGLGATPMIANPFVTQEQKTLATTLFSSIGLVTWTEKEEDIDSFTALSGSGPAYVFSFLQAMIDAAVALGLNPTTAQDFALQTVRGALKLAQDSDLSLNQLKSKVTSKGGTTEAALKVLDPQLEALMLATMKAAKHRSMELGKQLCQE